MLGLAVGSINREKNIKMNFLEAYKIIKKMVFQMNPQMLLII